MPNCSPMVEVEVEDEEYLPLTSVPAYTQGSHRNSTVQEGDDSEMAISAAEILTGMGCRVMVKRWGSNQ